MLMWKTNPRLFLFLPGTKYFYNQSQSAYIAPTLPSISDKIFNVRDYGAVGDSITDNTKAIQDAINAAVNAGGGRM